MRLARHRILRMGCLLAYVLAASLFVLVYRPTYLLSIAIVLIPPAAANWIWLRAARRKVLLFSLVTTVLFAPPVELASRAADAWNVQSVLPRPFGLMPLENILFAFLNFFWVLSFYAYFEDRDEGTPLPRRFRHLLALYLLLDAVVFGLYAIKPALIATDYALAAVPILVIPSLLIYWNRPDWLRRAWRPTAFFAVVFFVYETVSLCVGSWWWPGHYLWPTRLCGTTFPIDDVIIWYGLSTPALIGGYEWFAGGRVTVPSADAAVESSEPRDPAGIKRES